MSLFKFTPSGNGPTFGHTYPIIDWLDRNQIYYATHSGVDTVTFEPYVKIEIHLEQEATLFRLKWSELL